MKTLKKYILFSSILSLMLGAQALLVQIYMIQVYSRVIPSNNVDTLVAITIIIIFFLTLFSLVDYMRRYVLARGAVKLESELAGSVMLAGLRDEQQKMGDDFGLLREVSSLRAALTSAGFVALFDIVFLPLYLALLFYLHPLLGSVTLAGAVALLIIALANRWITALALQKHAEAANRSSLSALSQLSNAELIRAHGMYRETLRLWGSHYAESLTTYLRATNQSNLFDAASKAVRILIQIALLGFGGFLVIDGHMSAGIIFATSILGSRTLAPIEQVIGGWKALGQGLRAYTKVQEKLASNPETLPKMKLPRIEGRLDVEKLVYGFPGTEPILKGISLSVAPGNMIAIVGSNGGGKSTLARLMVGAIRPTAGAVRLDSNELSNWNPLELGPLIGYM